MDLEQLQLEADKDLKINDTELDLESLKTPQLHNKYMKHYTKFKLLLTRTEDELRTIKRDKWEYYILIINYNYYSSLFDVFYRFCNGV